MRSLFVIPSLRELLAFISMKFTAHVVENKWHLTSWCDYGALYSFVSQYSIEAPDLDSVLTMLLFMHVRAFLIPPPITARSIQSHKSRRVFE